MSFSNYAPVGVAFCLLLVGCGGSSSTPSTTPEGDTESVLTGVFVDSPVEGISFATSTQSGTTNAAGEFSYLAGEQVTFSVGAAQLPAVDAAAQVTPVDIAVSSSDPTAMTTNIARLLQSLDQDGNPENGITISASAAASAASVNFDVSVEDFANDAAVINLVANSGSVNSTLISAEAASQHLNETLGGDENSGVILDLRGTTWLESNETGCDGLINTVRVEFSQTGLSAFISRAEDRGAGCVRENPNFPETTYADANNTSAFILTCGGDGQCTFDELNREVLVPVGDPRNDCTQDGQAVDVNNRVSHVVSSDTITVFNCDPEDADIYVRQ